MKKYNGLNPKEWAVYITQCILYPFILLLCRVGRKARKFAARHRRITASVLAFCMILTLIPIPVLATPAKAEDAVSSGSTIVVDGTTYALTASGLTSAITAAADGNTIDIRADITLESTVEVNKSLTILSSNGSSLIRSTELKGHMITILSDKTLTLKKITLNGNNVVSSYAIYISASHLTMEDGACIKDNNGGGVYVNNSGTFTMNGGSITTNAATHGGGVHVNNSSTFTMNGGSITGNTAAYGGGVYVRFGTFIMNHSTISDNTATGIGGGVFNSGSFIMTESIITGNEAPYGGGMYVDNSSTFTMNDSIISGNTAAYVGGGIYNTLGNITMTNSIISSNISGNGGAGIYSASGTINMIGGSITNNQSSYFSGVGVYFNDGTFNVSGSACITDNMFGAVPSNVLLTSTKTISVVGTFTGAIGITKDGLMGTAVTGNVTEDNKDLFFIDRMTYGSKYYDTVLKDNRIDIQEVTDKVREVYSESELKTAISNFADKPYIDVRTNIALANTIGISGSKQLTILSSNGSMITRDASFTSQMVQLSGSGTTLTLRDVALDGNSTSSVFSAVTNTNTAKLVLNPGAVIQNNRIIQQVANNLYGGGIYNSNSVIIMNGGTISGNTAHQHGGGVYNIYNGKFTMNGGTISGNTATNNNGGGVYNEDIFTMNGGTILGNTATNSNGGGVFIGFNATFSMIAGAISNNSAFYGGGVYSYLGSTFTMDGGNISGNSVNSDGGGVHNYGTLTMYNGTISNNTADGYGGGVFNYGTFTMVDGSILKNNAGSHGGGVYNKKTFTMEDGSITGNEADFGGGVFNSDTFTIDGGNILKNIADRLGGGVYNSGSFTMSDSLISGNSSCSSGGGVFNNNGTFILDSGTISDNLAMGSYSGGGIYNQGTFTMNGGNLLDNAAHFGGGIHNISTFTMNGGNFSGNTAYDGGGVSNDGTFTMDGGNISGNTAEHFGAGVINSETFTMNSGTISDNIATSSRSGGGGVFNFGDFTMNNGTVLGNTAANGAGVYNNADKIFTMDGGSITRNNASQGGGVSNYGTLNISNGSIIANNANYGGGMINYGTLTMNDSTISGNTAIIDGGGVYNYGIFNIQGVSMIIDNRKGEGESTPINNVYLPANETITITGVLSGEVGVSMEAYGVAATGSTSPAYTVTQSDTYCFIPDVTEYASHLDSENNSIKISLLPVMAPLSAPSGVTAGDKLLTEEPIVTNNGFATGNHRFEIKKIGESYVTFDPQITLLDMSYNGASLRYAADLNDTTKTIYSNEVSVNVIKAAPALIIEVSPDNPTTYGNEVVLTAAFSGAHIPSGTIQFEVDGVNIGDPAAISGGKAVYRYMPNASDTAYSYTAIYSGDANNEPCNSAPICYTVNKANQSPLTVTSASTVIFGNTYTALVSGGTTGGAVIYEIIGGTGEGVFDGNMLNITKSGTIIYTAKMSGDSNYNDVISNAFTLTVNKAQSTIYINNDKTVTYSKNEVTCAASDVTVSGSSGAVTFKYYSDIACTNEIPAPINAGTYYVKAYVQADDNYNSAASEAAKITINPKPITIISVAVNDKTYDGKNTATISSIGTTDGVISGDIVTVKSGVCTFNNINAGNSIAVAASGFGIEGASAGNYRLTGQPAVPGANIISATLSVSVEKVTIKTGQQIPPLTVLVTGFVNGETESSLSSFEKPTATVSGTINTTDNDITGFIVSYTAGNATNNYTFQYNTSAQIEIQRVDITDTDYSADKDLAKWHNGDIIITPQNGYAQISTDKESWAASLALSLEGENNAVFYLKKPDGTLTESQTISYKIDNTAPTGEISIKENKFKSFINIISFGVFCKNTVDVSIVGADNLSNTSIEYMICKDEDITGHSYQEYTDTFSLNSKGTHVVFAKITDEAGNEIIICSDGVVVYEDSTASTEKVTYEKLTGADKSATVSLNGNTINSIMVADTIMTSSQCTVDGNTITLKGNYLETLAAGNYTVTVSYNPYGLDYNPANSNDDVTYKGDAPATTTFIIEVVGKPLTVGELVFTPPEDLSYNGGDKVAIVAAKADIIGIGTITVKYYAGDEKLSSAPVNAGTYTVKVDITDGKNYSSVFDLTVGTFAIVNADQPVPTTPSVTNTTTFGNNDGKITGVDSTMEYRKQGENSWTAINGTEVTGLSDGIYLVRYAAKENFSASAAKEVVIAKAKTKPTTPSTGDDSNIALWIIMLLACGAILLLEVNQKKNRRCEI